MAQAVEEWYNQMTIITHSYLTAAIVTTIGCSLDIISPYDLYLNLKLVVKHDQIWRVVKFACCNALLRACSLIYFLHHVLLGFTVLIGTSAWVDLSLFLKAWFRNELKTLDICRLKSSSLHFSHGMIAGYAYYFLEDVYPQMTGRRPLKTPSFIKSLFTEEPVVASRPANVRFIAPPV